MERKHYESLKAHLYLLKSITYCRHHPPCYWELLFRTWRRCRYHEKHIPILVSNGSSPSFTLQNSNTSILWGANAICLEVFFENYYNVYILKKFPRGNFVPIPFRTVPILILTSVHNFLITSFFYFVAISLDAKIKHVIDEMKKSFADVLVISSLDQIACNFYQKKFCNFFLSSAHQGLMTANEMWFWRFFYVKKIYNLMKCIKRPF